MTPAAPTQRTWQLTPRGSPFAHRQRIAAHRRPAAHQLRGGLWAKRQSPQSGARASTLEMSGRGPFRWRSRSSEGSGRTAAKRKGQFERGGPVPSDDAPTTFAQDCPARLALQRTTGAGKMGRMFCDGQTLVPRWQRLDRGGFPESGSIHRDGHDAARVLRLRRRNRGGRPRSRKTLPPTCR